MKKTILRLAAIAAVVTILAGILMPVHASAIELPNKTARFGGGIYELTQNIFADQEKIRVTQPVNLQDSLSNFFLAEDMHESTQEITIWKRIYAQGELYVAIRDAEGNTLATFAYSKEDYDWLDAEEPSSEWTKCSTAYKQSLTPRDIVDVAFTAYREVSGRNADEVQIQAMVLINRTNHSGFEDTLHGVITQKGQYACRTDVLKRRLKSNSSAEKADLEKALKAALLVYADEMALDVPENVVWAATFKQGKGTWMYMNGTYYCY